MMKKKQENIAKMTKWLINLMKELLFKGHREGVGNQDTKRILHRYSVNVAIHDIMKPVRNSVNGQFDQFNKYK